MSSIQSNYSLPFKAIYLDTNVLVESRWPKVSVKLGNVLSLASQFGIPVFIADPVEQEAQEVSMRSIRRSVADLEGAEREYRRQSESISGEAYVVQRSADLGSLRARYVELAQASKAMHRIQAIPLASRNVDAFFRLAIRYVLPFEEGSSNKPGEGRGFQDAVILSSVLEHLRSNPQLSGVFVTRDSVFSKISFAEFMPEFENPPLLIKDLDEVSELLLDKYVDENVMKPWEEERINAQRATENALPELTAFIQSHLEPHMLQETMFSKVLELRAVENVKVKYVQTSLPSPEKPDRLVVFAIATDVQCRALTEAQIPDLTGFFGGPFYAPSYRPPMKQEELSLPWLGGVEAAADVEGRQYKNLKFNSLLTTEQLGSREYYRRSRERKCELGE
jgi:hypothetical protein